MIVKDEYYKRASAVMSERRLIYKSSGGFTIAEAAYLMQQFDEIRQMVINNAAKRGVDLNFIVLTSR